MNNLFSVIGLVALGVKKSPMRNFAGCDELIDKNQLVRVVHTPEGEFMLDFTGKKSGRGVYVCKSRSCLEAAQKKRGRERSLKCAVPQEIYLELLKSIEESDGE